MSWFTDLSAKAQKDYIAAHPNSKYAKGSAKTVTAASSNVKWSIANGKLKVQLKTLRTQIDALKEEIKASVRKDGPNNKKALLLVKKVATLADKINSLKAQKARLLKTKTRP